ncbi:twin-arginine translocation signal domain-containing protein, partial [Acinetobacter baumannii]
MNSEDRRIGMDRAITRREFVNGAAVGAGLLGAGLPQLALGDVASIT